tara:strand:+ start:48 stop:968 length:921 start_codon:yes stop_codon:yes gene_type:complete
MKKLAIQLSGQLRNWNVMKKITIPIFQAIISFGKKYGIDIHLHGTFWDDSDVGKQQKEFWGEVDYTSKNTDFNIFKTINFIPLEKELFNTGKPLEHQRKDTYKGVNSPIAAWPWSWCMYRASMYRRLWQIENEVRYSVVLVTRPDIFFQKNTLKDIFNFVFGDYQKEKKFNMENYEFTIFTGQITHNMTISNFNFSRISDDTIVFGNEESVNLYCTNLLPLYIDNNLSFNDQSGHIAVPFIIQKLNLNRVSPFPKLGYLLGFNLIRINKDVEILDPEQVHPTAKKRVEDEWNISLNLKDSEDFHLW